MLLPPAKASGFPRLKNVMKLEKIIIEIAFIILAIILVKLILSGDGLLGATGDLFKSTMQHLAQ